MQLSCLSLKLRDISTTLSGIHQAVDGDISFFSFTAMQFSPVPHLDEFLKENQGEFTGSCNRADGERGKFEDERQKVLQSM